MVTHLPQNQYFPNSAPARTSPGAGDAAAVNGSPTTAAANLPNSAMPTAESAVAFSDPSGSDATAAPIQSSCGGVKEPPTSTSDYNGVKSPALVTAYGLSRKSCPLSRLETGPHDAIPASTGGQS